MFSCPESYFFMSWREHGEAVGHIRTRTHFSRLCMCNSRNMYHFLELCYPVTPPHGDPYSPKRKQKMLFKESKYLCKPIISTCDGKENVCSLLKITPSSQVLIRPSFHKLSKCLAIGRRRITMTGRAARFWRWNGSKGLSARMSSRITIGKYQFIKKTLLRRGNWLSVSFT